MTGTTYNVLKPDKGSPIKAWTRGSRWKMRPASSF
jgi:hypothetical protein